MPSSALSMAASMTNMHHSLRLKIQIVHLKRKSYLLASALPPTKGEGASVQYDQAQEGYTARYTHETVALAFAITEEAMEDNLYDTFSKLRARGLARAMANTKQVKAADVFNNGFTGGSYAGGDGVALFSASHPTISGNQTNVIGASDLSESSLEAGLIAISKIKDDRGILIGAQAVSLHVPTDLVFTADQVLNSTMSTTIGVNPTTATNGATNVNDINSVRNQGMVPGGFFVTVALLIRITGSLRPMCLTVQRCLSVHLLLPKWKRTSTQATFASRPVSVIASAGLTGAVSLAQTQANKFS